MTLPYPLPPAIPPCFVSGTIDLPQGYSIRMDEGCVHYLTFGSEDVLGIWPIDAFDDAVGLRAVRREIAKLIATHKEKMENWAPRSADDWGQSENDGE